MSIVFYENRNSGLGFSLKSKETMCHATAWINTEGRGERQALGDRG